MPKYKLVYFNARGRAETIRQVFAVAGQDFEDYRLKDGEWATFKPNAPFGQAPIMEIEGEGTLCQGLSIARYLAVKFGLAGKTELEQAQVNMIAECMDDAVKPLQAAFYSKDEAQKAEIKKKFQEEQFPESLAKFEKLLGANKSGFFVGDTMTWCDIHFATMFNAPQIMGIECNLDKYPKVAALKNKVESNDRIAAWIAKRPKTDF